MPPDWGRGMRRINRIRKDERGATAVEYGLILALIFLAVIGGVQAFTDRTIDMWGYVSNEVLARGN